MKADRPDSEHIRRFERINVVGTSGSGKSIFARELAERLGLPYCEMDRLFWLDPSLVRTVFRVTGRTIRRALTQEELWPGTGNRESLIEAFLSKKSIIWWAITTHRSNRRKYSSIMSSPAYSHICFVRLSSQAAAASFLQGLRDVAGQSHAPEVIR